MVSISASNSWMSELQRWMRCREKLHECTPLVLCVQRFSVSNITVKSRYICISSSKLKLCFNKKIIYNALLRLTASAPKKKVLTLWDTACAFQTLQKYIHCGCFHSRATGASLCCSSWSFRKYFSHEKRV